MNIVVCLQYWAGDRREADTLARFMADIEPKRRDDVKIRFVARYDCESLDMDTLRYVGTKFDISWTHSRRKWQGWPDGPNGMAYDILEDGLKVLEKFGWQEIDGFLMLEPDSVPLQRTWLDQLIAEWAIARLENKWMMGSFRQSGPHCGHLNGNAMVWPKLGEHVHLKDAPQSFAWDCYIAPFCKHHWHITGLIRNDFRSENATEQTLRTPEVGDKLPVLSHGFKDGSAMKIAREWLL